MLPDFSKLRILVIGDVMLDHYIWGDATRISPEAPVPVVHVARDSYVPGGAANVASNLAGLGVQTSILGSFGPDDGGHRLGEMLSEKGIHLLSSGCRKAVRTIVKTRLVVQRQQMCRIDREGDLLMYRLPSTDVIVKILEEVQPDAIIVSDYAKGVVSDDLLQAVKQQSEKLGIACLAMDPKPRNPVDLGQVNLITPNRAEALELARMTECRGAAFDGVEVARRIYDKYGISKILITLGAEGMLLCENGIVGTCIPAKAREVFDVSGAGDTVIAVLTACLAAGLSFEDSALLANRAAGVVVGHLGTVPISLEELDGVS